jgi:O-antigen/teichoic acid export membrane protein
MGVSTGLIYSRRDPARTAGTAVTLSAATSLVMTVAAWVAAPALAHGLHAAPDATWVIRGLVSVLPLYGIAAVPQELLRRELAFARRIVPDVVAALVGGAVSVCLVLAGHGLAGVVIGQIVQAVVTLVLSWIIGRVVLPAWDPTVAAELVRYGANLAAASLLGLVLLNVDYVLVSRVLGAQALGQYSLAFRLAYLPFVNIAFVIAGAGFPYLCRLVDRDIGPAVERMIAAGMSVVVPVCAAMAVFARQVELLGTKWAPAVGVVRWLAVYAALLALVQFVYTALNAVGNPGATLSLRLLHLVTLLVVLPIAVRHGIETVAIGQVIGGTVAVVAAFVVAQRKVPGWRLGAVARGLLPAVAGAGAMALVGVVLQQLLASTAVSVSGFVWVGALAGCAYLGLVVLLGGRDLKRSIDTLRGRP